jgi:hypothetical protein
MACLTLKEVNYEDISISAFLGRVSGRNEGTLAIALLHFLDDNALIIEDDLLRVVLCDRHIESVRTDQA